MLDSASCYVYSDAVNCKLETTHNRVTFLFLHACFVNWHLLGFNINQREVKISSQETYENTCDEIYETQNYFNLRLWNFSGHRVSAV
jgi:hypothetical protein